MRKINLGDKSGFTLTELLTVLAIISILATTIMVSLNVHRKRAQGGRVLAELSGVMQNIYNCKADDGTINAPAAGSTGGEDICSIGSAYGQWPDLSTLDGFTYDTSNGSDLNSSSWYYSANSAGNNIYICCNSRYERCQQFDSNPTCAADSALN